MATTFQQQNQSPGQAQGQVDQQGQGHMQNPGPQPVVVHVHVHMHNEEKKEKQEPPPPILYDQPHYGYETCQRGPPMFYETPQRSFQYARTLGLPQPRPMYIQNQLPRLVYSNSEPVPVYTSQTPRLVHQEYSPRGNAVSGSSDFENGGTDTQVRYVFKKARPIESGESTSSLDSGYRYNYLTRRNQTQDVARKDDMNHQTTRSDFETKTSQSQADIGPIFRPGYSEKYVRNVRRETVVKPGVRLPNTVSIKTEETATNSNDELDRKVYKPYKPLKDVFTDRHDAPVSFELKQPRFPYKFAKTGGLSGSRSMSALDGKTHDKHEVFERAKNRQVFKDEATGKTFRIHSMVPIQEEQKVGNSVMRRYRFTDDNYPPVYVDSPAIPKNKRNSMPAEMASFRLENSSPAYNLRRETEEAEQLHSILKNAR